MAYKFLYIDDNSKENAQGIITGLTLEGALDIIFDNPAGIWEVERDRILSDSFKEYDGLILDLNLEEIPNEAKRHSKYKGSSLAQEIRNISKSGEIREIPIVLFSAKINLQKYFDKTNEDLFDLIVSREELGRIYLPTRNMLTSLAHGYEILNSFKQDHNYEALLGISVDELDIMFGSHLQMISESPSHSIANFFIKNVLGKSGLLVSEELLATRLGILKSDSPDWGELLELLSPYKYSGVFCEGWQRWWMNGVERWWNEKIDTNGNLRTMKATEKVEKFIHALNLPGLISIKKIEKSRSDSFWTNCVGSGAPIDTVDGLLIAEQDNLYPWQDKSYISFEEALNPTNKSRWNRISPLEEYKLEQLKLSYPNERPKRQ